MRWRAFAMVPLVMIVAWLSSTSKSQLAVVDVALILGGLTVVAAVVDWKVGLIVSGISALSLNFFHTTPRHSLAVRSEGDLAVVMMLACSGALASVLARQAIHREIVGSHRQDVKARQQSLLRHLVNPIPVTSVWERVVDAADEMLDLIDVRLADSEDQDLPRLARDVPIDPDEREEVSHVTIPSCGAIASFRDPRLTDRVVFVPRAVGGSVTVNRRTLNHFLDDLELVVCRN